MAEADLPVRQLDDALLCSLLERRRVVEERLGWLRQRRGGSQDFTCASRQRLETLAQDCLESLRHGQGTAGLDSAAPSLQGAHQLERVERVPARSFMDSAQRGPSERNAELVAEEPVQRTRAQGAQPDSTDLEIGLPEAQRRLTLARHALSHEQSDRFLGQPARHELEHECCRWIQPLDVVNRHEYTPPFGQPPKGPETRSRDGPLIRRQPLVLRQEKRCLECPPLDGRQRSEHGAQHRLEQIGQPRERETGLTLGRTAVEHTHPPLASVPQPGPPHRRLADPGLTREHERRRQVAVEKGGDGGKLLVPADNLVESGCHAPMDYATAPRRFCAPAGCCLGAPMGTWPRDGLVRAGRKAERGWGMPGRTSEAPRTPAVERRWKAAVANTGKLK